MHYPPFASATAGAAASDVVRGVAHDVFKKGDSLAGGRYRLDSKIADGRFASIWLGSDSARSGAPVVLKLLESGDAPTYSAGAREAAAHTAAGRHPNIARLLATFEHRSKGGRHACMVIEPLGSSLEEAAALCGGGLGMGLPLGAVRGAARQALAALDHLHRQQRFVHMAVTPSNLLLDKPFRSLAPPPPSTPLEALWRSFQAAWGQVANAAANPDPGVTAAAAAAAAAASTPGSRGDGGDSYSEASLSRAVVKLCDFGRALPLDQLGEPQGREPLMIFASPGYRPPEEVLGLEYRGPSYDMWNLGCTLFSLATGSDLFHPERGPSGADQGEGQGPGSGRDGGSGGGGPAGGGGRRFWAEFDGNDAHLAQMVATLGRIPREMVKASPLRRVYFLPSGRLRVEARYDIERCPLAQLLAEGHGLEEDEAAGFAGFLAPLLEVGPERRPSAADMLRHKWLQEAEEDGGGDRGGKEPMAAAGAAEPERDGAAQGDGKGTRRRGWWWGRR